MRRSEPGWWHAAEATTAERLLRPLASLYGGIAMARYRRVRPYRSSLPVICVGNFTAGGTGKTPLTVAITAGIAERGKAAAVLTRGYGGRLAGPHWVQAERDRAVDVGDEPMLLSRDVRVMLARDRDAGAKAIEADGRVEVIVMDDGLQNPALAKDLAIAVVDGRRGLGNGQVIPAGPLRAPLAFQFGLVQAIVVNAGFAAPAEAAAVTQRLAAEFNGPVIAAAVAPVGDTGWLAGLPVVAYAGIGVPQHFFDMLANLGARFAATVAFADHQPFTQRAAERLLATAARHGATLVTTEKDLVRLAGADGSLARLRAASRPVAIRLVFTKRDASRLDALIDAVLKPRTRR